MESYDTYTSTSVMVDGDQSSAASIMDNYSIARYPYIASLALNQNGQWDETPSYASGETSFVDSNASFDSFMEGWQIIVNLEEPVILTISDVSSASTVKVKGDCDSLAAIGDYYLLSPPPGIAADTGTLGTVDASTDAVDIDVLGNGSRYLWAHYKHMPAMAGWYDYGTSTTAGAQTGANKLGTYNCWNRVYDIAIGRWTSPDPAARPWSNLQDYVGSNPVVRTDPTGLSGGYGHIDSNGDWVTDIPAVDVFSPDTWKRGARGWIRRHTEKRIEELDTNNRRIWKEVLRMWDAARRNNYSPNKPYGETGYTGVPWKTNDWRMSEYLIPRIEDACKNCECCDTSGCGVFSRDLGLAITKWVADHGANFGELGGRVGNGYGGCDCSGWVELLTNHLRWWLFDHKEHYCTDFKIYKVGVSGAAGDHSWTVIEICGESIRLDPWFTKSIMGRKEGDSWVELPPYEKGKSKEEVPVPSDWRLKRYKDLGGQ